MDPNKTTIERAFELAYSGKCKTINQIKSRLKAERYNPDLIEGRSLLMQLRTIMADAAKK